jgi:putative hemolysin
VVDLPWHIGLLVVAALLLANALFVAAEFAFVTVRRTRMKTLADDGGGSAVRVLQALGNLDYFVAASQLGITMASIALGFVGEPVLAHLIEPPIESVVGSLAPAFAHAIAIGVAFFLITALHIVLGEFVPKTIALQQPERTSLAIIGPISAFSKLFGPVIWLLNTTGNAILGLFGLTIRPLTDQPLSSADLAYSLESSASAGLISRRDLDLAQHALELEMTRAVDVMTPRNEVTGIAVDADRPDVLRQMVESGHTRYPVYRQNLDQIVGVVDAKHVLLDDSPDDDWRRHIVPPVIVPESSTISDLIVQTRVANSELAIVVDEYGGMAGIVSLFDVAEHLAGRLPEEFDTRVMPFQPNQDGTTTVSGRARIDDLRELLGDGAHPRDVHTVAGLVIAALGRIPQVGDEIQISNCLVRVLSMDRHRVDQLLFMPVNQNETLDEGSSQ